MTRYEHGPGYAERPQASLGTDQSVFETAEFGFADFARLLGKSKFWMFGGGGLFLLATAFLLFSKELIQPMPVSYSTAIVVTMNGVENGQYPNGVPYSVTDLRSAAVLEEVYRVNKLQDYGINLADFLGMVSVASYSPAFTVAVDRYRQRLADKNLTFEERKSIESEFQQSINSLNASGLTVTLTVDRNLHLPAELGTKIVDDIPSIWADIFTKRLGVTSLPILVSGSSLVDEALAAKLDYPLGFDYLRQQADVTNSQIQSLSSISGVQTFISSKSKSLADITRDFAAFETFQLDLGLKPLVDLGLSKDVELTSLVYENRIQSLNRDAITQSEYSTKVGGVLRSIGSAPAVADPNGQGAPASNFSAQIDGAFVDKIVELSQKGSSFDFEKELQRQRLGFENQTVSLEDRRSRFMERLSALRQTSLQGIEKQQLEKKFLTGYAEAISEMNSIWSELVDLSREFSGTRLNYDKTLYRLSSLPADVRVSKAALLDTRSALLSIVALILGAALGFFAYLFAGLARYRTVR